MMTDETRKTLSQLAAPRPGAQHRKALSFGEILETHRRGDVLTAADEALSEVVTAVEERGGKGSVTVKLTLQLDKGGVVKIVPTVEAKKPAKPISDGFYYPQGEGRLGRFDPRQTDIEDPS